MKKREQIAGTRTRQLRIGSKAYARKNGYVYFPSISLSGKWLREYGFENGQLVDITCEDGKLVITIVNRKRKKKQDI